MNIYIHTPSWFISKNNTDINLRKNFTYLNRSFKHLNVFIPFKFIDGIEFNLKYIYNRLKNILGIKNKFSIQVFNLGESYYKSKFDIIISQGHFPKMRINDKTPVIWEIFFMNPKAFLGESHFIEEGQWFKNHLPIYRDYAKSASIIGVRDFYSIELFKRLIPEYGHKIRFLPFYLPDLEYMNEQEIISKHQNSNVIKILFVGNQSNRKDLPSLINALKIVNERYKGKVELSIVSKLSDGKIEIPKDLPINHYKGLPYKETLELFRSSHIYAMTSKIETFGLSYLEGLSHGCAVIARDNYPQREILENGKCGLLVTPTDVNTLVDKLILLINDDTLRIELALNGVLQFKNKYHWSKVGILWENVFREISLAK